MDKKKLRGVLCALIGGMCWGFSGCFGQYLFSEKNMDSYWLTTVRLLSSGIVLIIISLFAQRKNLIETLKCKKDFMRIACFGIFGLMLCQLSYLTAIKYTNAATATVIQYSGPVLVMVVVCVINRKLPKIPEAASVILATVGTFLIATHGNPSNLAISKQGLVWCISAALSVVLYTLIPGDVTERRSSVVVSGLGMTMGGIVLFFALGVWRIPVSLDLGALLALAGIILIGTVAAFSLYLQAISDIGPVKASILASVEPVTTAVVSWLWLGSRFAPMDLLGFACVISTVFLLALKKDGKAQAEKPSTDLKQE